MGTCYNSTVVNAPVDQVWRKVRDFHDLGWAKGVVTKAEVVGKRSSVEIGAQRILNEAFHETLLSLDDRERRLSYSIDDGPGPVAKGAVKNYVGSVRVSPVTDGNATFVEWSSRYDSPNDAAVGELCNPIYKALLDALKKHFG